MKHITLTALKKHNQLIRDEIVPNHQADCYHFKKGLMVLQNDEKGITHINVRRIHVVWTGIPIQLSQHHSWMIIC